MDPRNFANFSLSFAIILLFLVAIPSVYDAVSKFALVLFVMKLAEWMMTRTRRYVLHKKVSSRNKAVFITGCDTGFGNMVAERLDQLGYHVFAGCLNAKGEGAKNLANNCSSNLLIIPLDVTSDASVSAAAEFVKENLGDNELWAVVNNAGIAHAGEIDWTPVEEFQSVYDVNANGMVRVTKAFLSLLQISRGRVINNTSMCGRLTCPGYVGYCMSKSAAVSFTTGLRVEMVKWGVKAISIEPFFYKTPLTQPEAGCKAVENTWNNTTEEVRAKYGDSYKEAFKKSCENILNQSSPKTEEVIYCFEDAITAVEPLSRYIPCHLIYKIAIKMSWELPSIVSETYQHFQMPFSVKPLGLMKKTINGVKKLH